MENKRLILCIMDGFGIREETYGNAIKNANTPNLDFLFKEYPSSLLDASEESVGLPIGQMGNSEVGHMNIGAGRVVYQSLTLINNKIKDKTFFSNEKFKKTFNHVKKYNSSLHLFCLLSDGGVHSHINHLLALLDAIKVSDVKDVKLHLFLDGRDVPPKSSLSYIKTVKDKLKELKLGTIASIQGRYYAMDRDKNFDRTIKAYDAIVNLKGNKFSSPSAYIKKEYRHLRKAKWEVSDEFVMPGFNKKLKEGLKDKDAVIFVNFRPDRAIQLSTLITNPKFYKNVEVKELKNICFVSMMKYADSVKGEVAFKLDPLDDVLGEVLERNNLNQLRIAETEKYAHVTYFLDGTKKYDGVELKELKGCKRILIDSPKVSTYDLKPEMSAYKVTDALIKEIKNKTHDVIIVNYANCDMVGHTAVYDAVIKAVEVVDECVGKVYKEAIKNGYDMIVTADHGNADMVFDLNDNLVSSHTLSKVPFLITRKDVSVKDGKLADIAPTMLSLLGIKILRKMTGNILINKKEEK